jgi:hypothetical protein
MSLLLLFLLAKEDDVVGAFFRKDAETCFRFADNLESKLFLAEFERGEEECVDNEGLEVEDGKLLRISAFFGPFLLQNL